MYQIKKNYFSAKTYVVGSQKNCLNETVLLSTQNIGKKILKILHSKFSLSKPILTIYLAFYGILIQIPNTSDEIGTLLFICKNREE